jgi:LacI family transcriptional regulator
MTQAPDFPHHGRPPTIRDVAKRAGVAPGTVSNVLTGRKPVAEPLKRSVLEAVEVLGYRANQLASNLRMRQTRSIGVVIPDLTNPFFALLIQHIERLAARDGYQILLMSSHEDEIEDAERIRALISRQVDGLVIAPAIDAIGPLLDSLTSRPPILVLDRATDNLKCDTVASDNQAGAYEGCRHLLELGHRDIVFLATSEALANVRERVAGFHNALRDYGAAHRSRVIFGGLTVDSCRGAIEQELRRADRPTAIFCGAYVATLGAVKAIRAVDLEFPKHMSLLGFDDADWMTALRPYISTVEQPLDAMSREAWKILKSRLDGTDRPAIHTRLSCILRVRESTQAR